MKKIIIIFLWLLAIFLGFYIGLYQCIILGIVKAVDIIKTQNWDGLLIALTIVRIISGSFLGWLSACIPISISILILENDK